MKHDSVLLPLYIANVDVAKHHDSNKASTIL